jgi:uncharacterized protein (DUF1501 family)
MNHHQSLHRRAFLKSGALALVAFGLGGTPLFLPRAAAQTLQASSTLRARKKTLVCIFQRGAMDGLMAVPPFADPYLAQYRPRLAMAAPSSSNQSNQSNGLIDLDGKFGLHPAFKPFEQLFREQRLAIVHGMGSPNTTRSHFDAQDYMETGTPFIKGTPSGWLNRASGLLRQQNNQPQPSASGAKAQHQEQHKYSATTPFQAVAIAQSLPKSLYGTEPALALTNIEDFGVRVGSRSGNHTLQASAAQAAQSFEVLYAQASERLLRGTGSESFDAVKILSEKNLSSFKPAPGVQYPSSPLGESLRQIAQLIKADVGLEIAFAETGGWDTHVQQGTVQGTFAARARDLAQAINAFWTDIAAFQDEVAVMTMTEFGRTVRENGSGGTDHGRGSCLFVLGNNVEGGKIHGNVPPLAPENLADGRDLPVTTDFRAIFAEVAGKHLGLNNDAVLFPDWNGERLPLMR